MKVVHISPSLKTPIGQSVLEIANSQLAVGIQSAVLVNSEESKLTNVVNIVPAQFPEAANDLRLIGETYLDKSFSGQWCYSGLDISGLEVIHKSDIINLHSFQNLVSPSTLRSLSKLGKPIVYTLHTAVFFSQIEQAVWSHESYANGTDPLGLGLAMTKDIARLLKELNISLVSSYQYLSQNIKASLGAGVEISQIPLPFNSKDWYQDQKGKGRELLGIGKDVVLMLIKVSESDSGNDFLRLRQVLNQLVEDKQIQYLLGKEKIRIMVLNKATEQIRELPMPFILVQENALAEPRQVYSLADLFVFTGKVDQAASEVFRAMAVGLPVIAYNHPGSSELMSVEQSGCLIDPSSPEVFASKLKEVILSVEKRAELGLNSPEVIQAKHQPKLIGDNYASYYGQVLNRPRQPVYGPFNVFTPRWNVEIEPEVSKILPALLDYCHQKTMKAFLEKDLAQKALGVAQNSFDLLKSPKRLLSFLRRLVLRRN